MLHVHYFIVPHTGQRLQATKSSGCEGRSLGFDLWELFCVWYGHSLEVGLLLDTGAEHRLSRSMLKKERWRKIAALLAFDYKLSDYGGHGSHQAILWLAAKIPSICCRWFNDYAQEGQVELDSKEVSGVSGEIKADEKSVSSLRQDTRE